MHDPNPSFTRPQGSANIDFVFMRKVQLDGLARQGKCLSQFPLASWRCAPDHAPILMSFPKNWKCWFMQKLLRAHQNSFKIPLHCPAVQESAAWETMPAKALQVIHNLPLDPTAIHKLKQWTAQYCTEHFVTNPKAPTAVDVATSQTDVSHCLDRSCFVVSGVASPSSYCDT